MKALKSAPTSPSDSVVPLAASMLKEMPHRSDESRGEPLDEVLQAPEGYALGLDAIEW